jgi:hypothetical protein
LKNVVFWDVVPCEPPFSPLGPDTWIALLGRPFRLSSIPTVLTEMLVSVSVSHGCLSSAPSRKFHNMTPDTCYEITSSLRFIFFPYGATFQKTAVFTVTAIKIPNSCRLLN